MNKKQKQAFADLMKGKPVWCAAVAPHDYFDTPNIIVGVFSSKSAANRWIENRDDRMEWFVSELKLIEN